MIVKRVSGMTLKDFASKNIFQPLEMTHTTFRDEHTMLIPNRALAYDPGPEGSYKLDVSYYEQLGDGAVHTSIEDLKKWDDNFYSGRIGGRAFLEELQQTGKLNNGKSLDYAKGLSIKTYRGLHTVRHGGAWGGYRAELLRFPDQHFSVACLCNLANANPEKRAEEVAEVYLGRLMKPDVAAHAGERTKASPGITLTPEQITAFTGMYRDPEKRNVARVSVVDGKLKLKIFGGSFALRAISATRLVFADLPADITLTFEPTGDGTHRVMKTSGSDIAEATYQPVTQAAPTAAELAAYAGDFKSDELGVIYRLRVLGRNLSLAEISDCSGIPRTGMRVPDALSPTIADEFEISSQASTIDFVKNARNDITGFSLNGAGIQGIEFQRTTELGGRPTTF